MLGGVEACKAAIDLNKVRLQLQRLLVGMLRLIE